MTRIQHELNDVRNSTSKQAAAHSIPLSGESGSVICMTRRAGTAALQAIACRRQADLTVASLVVLVLPP